MSKQGSDKTFIDLFMTLTLVFLVAFAFYSLYKITDEIQDASVNNQNNILISIKWSQNCDVDLHLMLPDHRMIGYFNREEPPAYLDIDILGWNAFIKPNGETYLIKDNEEIITIRDVLQGEYIVNVHLYDIRLETDVEFEIFIFDVRNKTVIYADKRMLSRQNRQEHVVRFTVKAASNHGRFGVYNVIDNRPIYFIGRNR